MITNANDYVFTDVTGVDVTGHIVPALEGTAGIHVIRFEDIPFLTEMFRERMYWDVSGRNYDRAAKQYRTAPPNNNYDPHNRVITHRNLYRIANGIPREMDNGSLTTWLPKAAVLPSSIVFIGNADNAVNYLVSNATGMDYEPLPPLQESDFKRIVALDDLRGLYYNLANLQRMLLRGICVHGVSVFDWQYTTSLQWPNYHWMGFVPNYPSGSSIYTTTYYSNLDGTTLDEPQIYTEKVPGIAQWRLRVDYNRNCQVMSQLDTTTPDAYLFLTKGYGARIKGNGFALAATLSAWVVFRVIAQAHESELSFKIIMPVNITRESVYLSSLSGAVDSDNCYYKVVFPETLIKQQAFAYARSNCENFSTRPTSLQITFDDLIIDSGPIWMNSEIDSRGHYEIENNKPVWHKSS